MLVLTRKQKQTVIIDGRITVTILHVAGKGIRLGIDAPAEVSIRRGELEPIRLADEQQAA